MAPPGPSGPSSQPEKAANTDFPPFSRVFVVCSRTHKEEDIRQAFQRYGNVEDVWMVKDRMTKENKGICYIKFDKASAAALAIEALDGHTIGDEPKPVKVLEHLHTNAHSHIHSYTCTHTHTHVHIPTNTLCTCTCIRTYCVLNDFS